MGFMQHFSFGRKFRQRLNSRRSNSSLSTNSEIDMADFKKCSTSNQPQNQPIASSDDSTHGALVMLTNKPILVDIDSPEPPASDTLDEEGSNLTGFNKKPVPDYDSNLINNSGGLFNEECGPDNDCTNHSDLPGELIERSDGELGRNGAGVSKQHGRNEELRRGNDTIVKNSTDNSSGSNITLPPAKPFVRYIPVLPTTKPLESAFARKNSVQPSIKMPMSVGPFGGPGGSRWDDGVHHGVKTIQLSTGWIVDSIIVEYIDQNGDMVETRHGGEGGLVTHKIEFDYPNEYIISIWGYYGRLMGETDMYIRSLTFQTNIKTYGPFGIEEGKYFSCPATGGKVIGFYGWSDSFLSAIGAYMELSSHI